MNNKRGGFVIPLLGAIVAITVIAGGAWFICSKKKSQVSPIKAVTTYPTSSNSLAQTSNTGWKTYQSKQLGFTIKYPSNWTVREESVTARAGVVMGTSVVLIPPTSNLTKDLIRVGAFGLPGSPGAEACPPPQMLSDEPQLKDFKCDDSSGVAVTTFSTDSYILDVYDSVRKSISK